MSSEPLGSRQTEPTEEPPPVGGGGGLSGWWWIPTLYFAESIPNSVVSDTAAFMYTDLGLDAASLGLVTGSMYLPWVIKPLWSPLIDLFKTKRLWIGATQVALGLCFFMLAAALHLPEWLRCTAAVFWLMAIVSATHDIAADGFYMLGLSERHQAAFTGIRATFYRGGMICAKGFFVAFAGRLVAHLGDKVQGWSLAMCIPGLFYLAIALYHMLVLPRPASDKPAPKEDFFQGYTSTFVSFFNKPNIVQALAFMLLFRLAEAQIMAMVAPFLTNARDVGGLALTTEQVGHIYGTIGVLGMLIGGITAGMLVARFGLRSLYWVLIITMHIPNAAFLYLAFAQPENLMIIGGALFIEQFGYGFGFTAYSLYLLYFSRGLQRTSHYAICTGFMALSLMLPKMVSGYVKNALGFHGFYIYIMICTLPSFWVAWQAWRDKQFIDYFPAAQPKN